MTRGWPVRGEDTPSLSVIRHAAFLFQQCTCRLSAQYSITWMVIVIIFFFVSDCITTFCIQAWCMYHSLDFFFLREACAYGSEEREIQPAVSKLHILLPSSENVWKLSTNLGGTHHDWFIVWITECPTWGTQKVFPRHDYKPEGSSPPQTVHSTSPKPQFLHFHSNSEVIHATRAAKGKWEYLKGKHWCRSFMYVRDTALLHVMQKTRHTYRRQWCKLWERRVADVMRERKKMKEQEGTVMGRVVWNWCT